MKLFTERHLEILENIEIEKYVQDVVIDLKEFNFNWAYPNRKEEYPQFVYRAYKDSLKYGLETQKDCYAFIIAWHTLGDEMGKIKWLMDIIESEENYTWEKREALLCASYEKIDEVEGV